MMRCILPGIAALVAAPAGLFGQHSLPAPAFEVASVKPVDPDILRSRGLECGFLPSGRFHGIGNLRWFVACAYDLRAAQSRQQIVGAPRWADDDLFEIRATFTPSAWTPSQKLSMLQTLLADRFKLAVHRERREVPGYALVIARKDGRLGPHLQPTPKACTDWIAGGQQGGGVPMIFGDLPCGRGVMSAYAMRQTRVPLSQLANLLSPRVERPVEDRTGLTGMYAFDLRWAADSSSVGSSGGLPSTATPDNLPTSIFTAVEEQLGLKLEAMRSSAEFLIVDHVERPAPN